MRSPNTSTEQDLASTIRKLDFEEHIRQHTPISPRIERRRAIELVDGEVKITILTNRDCKQQKDVRQQPRRRNRKEEESSQVSTQLIRGSRTNTPVVPFAGLYQFTAFCSTFPTYTNPLESLS